MYIQIPYTDFKKLEEDSVKLDDVKELLGTTFPDDTCQLIAIKALLGVVDASDSTGDGE